MKPKPLSALNHFTVPVAMCSSPLSVMPRRDLAAPTASLPVLAPEPGPGPGHGLPQRQLADNDVLHCAARTARSASVPAARIGPAGDQPVPGEPAAASSGAW